MGETFKIYTCPRCNKEFSVSKGNADLIIWKGKHYHTDCFVDMCNWRVLKQNKYSPSYQEALDNIDKLKKESIRTATFSMYRDELNEHLLLNYDVVCISKSFWTKIADIREGEFCGKKCRPTETEVIVATWKWCQKELDSINIYNKSKKKGPSNDEQRIPYDLAIVLGKVPEYLRAQTKIKADEAERALQAKQEIKIDYSKIKPKKETNGLGDISDLLDELL